MLKRTLCLLMAVFSFSTSVVSADTITTISGDTVSNVSPPAIEAESAIIVDIKTGQQLYGKNIYEKHYPASITKIMTCMLSLENLDMSETIVFSETAVDIEIGSSAAYAVVGEEVGIKDCIYGLMVHSCNDFANGLAEAVSGDLQTFAKLMTSTAKELGCVNTNFVNAHGLDDENHYTCAYDMALIGKYAYVNYPTYKDIIAQQRYQVEPTNKCDETRYWKNGNELILKDGYYYYEPCLGGKTGYTEIAKYTLVSYANINGRELICVMLKAPSKGVAMEETKLLYEYIKENVPVEYYAEIDKAYEEKIKEEESKRQEEESKKKLEEDDTKAVNAAATSEKGNDKGSNFLIRIIVFLLKVILVLFVALLVFVVVFYCYLRYKLYLKKKKRLEQRRRRQMAKRRQAEERYRQTRFYNNDGEEQQ